MKKLILFLVAILAFSLNACRETTQEKTQDAIEAIGEDIEDNAKKAGEKIEEGAEKVKKEIDEEIHETDDINGQEANDDY
ncbi:MAG: hypothetical protein RI572_11230 [Salegentibacter sp.]|uniref:YtxH domain-containing protein n=1 Tax=Salegentibacter flavus TaxID=287099 RepID=A0A1I4YVL7_9FLAO|nr:MULTISPECIES: hypothetical protein [Salegentibacter]MDR9457970.1 hypothetical protein [Salegentibacter sp.]SFN42052.1 hypothetical protein SAMN05660413_00977 [Salegentibacter flavus]